MADSLSLTADTETAMVNYTLGRIIGEASVRHNGGFFEVGKPIGRPWLRQVSASHAVSGSYSKCIPFIALLMEPTLGLTILIIVVVALVVVVAALLGIAALKPDAFRIERSATIKAPADRIFEILNDLHRWGAWSPWEKLDPAMKKTYSGAASGPGAVYDWEGNKQVGQGRMEITQTLPPAQLTIKLDFFKPFEAHNTAEFKLDRQGDNTNVTWAMFGRQPFMLKVMGLFMSMDKMVGKDFETGLANLKSLTEK
jgi:hypothetical protein